MNDFDSQIDRIDRILGGIGDRDFSELQLVFLKYLCKELRLPCKVTGTEDFQWEEYYVLGPGKSKTYSRLKKTQPSFSDTYDLLEIRSDVFSEWSLFRNDLKARVRRDSDQQEFWLGLAELKAMDEQSCDHELLNDYSVFFYDYR